VRALWTTLRTERLPNSSTPALLPLALFGALQIADAVLTIAGVQRFGPAAEANPLLASAITSFGAYTTLAAAKAVALILGVALHVRSQHLVLAMLTVIYVFFAVCPWAIALATY
jgi:hypothetical protein